jgi:hypothetical protein
MHALVTLLFFLGQPFWETKPPEKWTDQEVKTVLQTSPWVQSVAGDPVVQIYLATATPIEQAEAELRSRSKKPLPPLDPDYLDYLRENREQAFVLAIPYSRLAAAGSAEEDRRMEEETQMKIGRKTYKILGHFPPTTTDPVLRLVFPRAVKRTDKMVEFNLYLPGVSFPERDAAFYVSDLLFRGKVEM